MKDGRIDRVGLKDLSSDLYPGSEWQARVSKDSIIYNSRKYINFLEKYYVNRRKTLKLVYRFLITNMVTPFFFFMDAAHNHGPRVDDGHHFRAIPVDNKPILKTKLTPSRPSPIRSVKIAVFLDDFFLSSTPLPRCPLLIERVNRLWFA